MCEMVPEESWADPEKTFLEPTFGNGNIVHASNSQPYPAGGIKISPYNYSTPIRIVRYWS